MLKKKVIKKKVQVFEKGNFLTIIKEFPKGENSSHGRQGKSYLGLDKDGKKIFFMDFEILEKAPY